MVGNIPLFVQAKPIKCYLDKKELFSEEGLELELSHMWNTERQELVVMLSVRCKKNPPAP